MALRVIRTDEDPLLRKISRPIKNIDERTKTLLNDMLETMYDAQGIGLAAPQVGILRRCITVDVGEGPHQMINPEIIEETGSDIDVEGCLSVPNFNGTVERPEEIKVKYQDIDGVEHTIEASGLFARCICHEIDHLDGILFTDKYIDEVNLEELMKELEEEKSEDSEDVQKEEN